MLRCAANLGMLFKEHRFLDRFPAAARAGFSAVEFPRLYDAPAEAVARALRDNGLHLIQFGLPRGNIERGDRGVGNDPDRRAEFREGLAWAVDFALAVGCPLLTCPVGNALANVPLSHQWDTLAENLKYAGDSVREGDLTILVEPLNPYDHPGSLMTTMRQAYDLIQRVDTPNVRIMCDIYHMQRVEGNLVSTLSLMHDGIGHVQIADSPDRHEPGTGEIRYTYVLRKLVEVHYNGWIGLEYEPSGVDTLRSLAWLAQPTFASLVSR